jgi:hypothetical protein
MITSYLVFYMVDIFMKQFLMGTFRLAHLCVPNETSPWHLRKYNGRFKI